MASDLHSVQRRSAVPTSTERGPTFIGGLQSDENRQVGLAMTQQVTRGRVAMLDGSHLYPMEKPLATAAAIEASLRSLEA